jgi:hypothetical protein
MTSKNLLPNYNIEKDKHIFVRSSMYTVRDGILQQ